MNRSPEHLRQDIEDQFELPEMPPRMTAKRSLDFKTPCGNCAIEQCPCIGWKAFDVAK